MVTNSVDHISRKLPGSQEIGSDFGVGRSAETALDFNWIQPSGEQLSGPRYKTGPEGYQDELTDVVKEC